MVLRHLVLVEKDTTENLVINQLGKVLNWFLFYLED
ncbi:hypothetical protein IGJ26_003215 [Enterococcus sp. AZ095a]